MPFSCTFKALRTRTDIATKCNDPFLKLMLDVDQYTLFFYKTLFELDVFSLCSFVLLPSPPKFLTHQATAE